MATLIWPVIAASGPSPGKSHPIQIMTNRFAAVIRPIGMSRLTNMGPFDLRPASGPSRRENRWLIIVGAVTAVFVALYVISYLLDLFFFLILGKVPRDDPLDVRRFLLFYVAFLLFPYAIWLLVMAANYFFSVAGNPPAVGTVSERGLHIEDATDNTKSSDHSWDSYIKFKESDDFILLYLGKNQFQVVAWNLFEIEEE